MKTFYRLSFLLFLLIPYTLKASELDQVLSDLQSTYQNVNDWSADFDQSTFVEVLNKDIKKQGKISIKKPGKIHIEYNEAGGKLYLSDGKTFWVYTPGDSQVIVYSKMSSALDQDALVFLDGLGNLKKQFSVQVTTSPDAQLFPGNLNLEWIELTPYNPNAAVTKIILGIDKKTHYVKETTLFNVSGNKTHYLFKNIQINPNLPDSFFEFKKTKDVREVKG